MTMIEINRYNNGHYSLDDVDDWYSYDDWKGAKNGSSEGDETILMI